jgi:hypothetical protein
MILGIINKTQEADMRCNHQLLPAHLWRILTCQRRRPGILVRVRSCLKAIVVLLLLCSPLLADTPVLNNSAGNSGYTLGSPAIVVDSQITTTGTDAVSGARVYIGNLFTGDVLGYSVGARPGGVTGVWDSASGVLSFTGSAVPSDWQVLLRTVTFATTSINTTARVINFTLGGSVPNPANGHFYEFISSPNITWTDAKTAAEGRSLFGLTGYLVTVTDAAENEFCKGKLGGVLGWMGASDADTEGTWRWKTGPEGLENGGLGRNFYTGIYPTGAEVPPYYSNWSSGEPNNASDEDYAHFLASGQWNDYANATPVNGYLVEYGGLPVGLTLTISDTKTVDIRSGFTVTFQTDGAPDTSLTGFTSQTVAYNGSSTAVTAIPSSCWYFVNWTGTGGFSATNSNPLTVANVTSDMVITANFSVYTYALNYLAGANGSIAGSTLQVVNCGTSGTAVTATGTPGSSYTFLNWSDGSVVNPRTDANVTANIQVTATFATQETEPNNSFAQATWVSGPGLCVGRVQPAGLPTDPSDYYRIILPQGSTLQATLTPPANGLRYFIYIYNQMGRVVAQGTSSAVARNIGVGPLSYYVVIRTTSGSSPSTYQLNLLW